jgi:hypothetical protein
MSDEAQQIDGLLFLLLDVARQCCSGCRTLSPTRRPTRIDPTFRGSQLVVSL